MSSFIVQTGKNILDKTHYVLEKIEDASLGIAALGLFTMMVLVTANAVGRYQFSQPVTGTVETTEMYLMPIVIFMIAASLQRKEGNVRVDIVYRKFSDSRKTLIDLGARTFALFIFGIIAYSAADHAWEAYQASRVIIGPIQFPVWLSWGIMAAGLFTFCIRLLIQIASDLLEVYEWR